MWKYTPRAGVFVRRPGELVFCSLRCEKCISWEEQSVEYMRLGKSPKPSAEGCPLPQTGLVSGGFARLPRSILQARAGSRATARGAGRVPPLGPRGPGPSRPLPAQPRPVAVERPGPERPSRSGAAPALLPGRAGPSGDGGGGAGAACAAAGGKFPGRARRGGAPRHGAARRARGAGGG